MARYIDAELFADRLLNAWDTEDKEKKTEIVAILSDIVTPILVGTPTADVAPRAEVAKIFEEIEKIRLKEIHKCETLREKESDPSEWKYWEGGTHSLLQLSYWIAELKKKYTETEGE